MSRLAELRSLARELGLRGALDLFVARRRSWRGQSGTAVLRARGSRHPLHARLDASDIPVFEQVFVANEYARIEGLPGITTILDLGANVGYTSARLLSAYPAARLLAVEPSDDNVQLLHTNLAPFGTRADVLHGAVWPVTADLVIEERPYRDGAAWSRQVREARPGEPGAFRGWSPGDLIARLGGDRVSLLKMDIEGAEAALLGHPDLGWLDRVDHLAIELHDDSSFGPATPLLEAALRSRPHRRTHAGETTVCHFAAA